MTSSSEEHTGLICKVKERLEKYAFSRKEELPKSTKRWEVSTRPHSLTYQKKALLILLHKFLNNFVTNFLEQIPY
jgi:hypothetical protein